MQSWGCDGWDNRRRRPRRSAVPGSGLLLAVAGWQRPAADRIRPAAAEPVRPVACGVCRGGRPRRSSWLPLVVLAVTGWPVLAGWTLVGGACCCRGCSAAAGEAARRLERLAALAEWTRRLASVLTAGAGLEHAINATTPSAPRPIAADVTPARRAAPRPATRRRRAAGVCRRAGRSDRRSGRRRAAAGGRPPRPRPDPRAGTASPSPSKPKSPCAVRSTPTGPPPRATARYVTIITLVTAALLVLTRRSLCRAVLDRDRAADAGC